MTVQWQTGSHQSSVHLGHLPNLEFGMSWMSEECQEMELERKELITKILRDGLDCQDTSETSNQRGNRTSKYNCNFLPKHTCF